MGRRFCIHILGSFLLAGLLAGAAAAAESVERQFYRAEGCYQKLREHPGKQKFRHNWFPCIQEFMAVHRRDPEGPWAAAGLYKAATLYNELYRHSYLQDDRQAAIKLYLQIISDYPQSRYHPRAVKQLKQIDPDALSRAEARASEAARRESEAKQKFFAAQACYRRLSKDAGRQKYRSSWMTCIEKFQDAHDHDPEGPWAAASLYRVAWLYHELHGHSYRSSDKRTAVSLYERIIAEYPQSRYRPRSAAQLRRIAPAYGGMNNDTIVARVVDSTRPKTPAQAQPATAPPPAESYGAAAAEGSDTPRDGKTTVTGLRFWSNPRYTRVVIDADDEASYVHHLLKKDPKLKKPQRLFVDVFNSRLSPDIQRLVPINDDLLSDARAGQFKSDQVRVVVDIKSIETYKIFSLRNPFRIVIDMWGEQPQQAPAAEARPDRPAQAPKVAGSSLARALALGVSRIVIDPGHGGKDYGAPGYLRGVHEKRVVLSIAKLLAAKIRRELGCQVIMTRESDRYLTLEERTAIANTENADLFVSLHTNAHRDRRAYGIETYFLNLATDDESIRVAARENATSAKNISDLQTILNDLMQNAKINESSRLAGHIQTMICHHLKSKGYYQVKNKGVKQAPFYVLLGAQMPAVLIETSFISNKRECKRLVNPKYQERLCEGIIKGIREYILETNPTALQPGRDPESRG